MCKFRRISEVSMDTVKIGQFIASQRREKGLTQKALGDMLGVTNKTISRWETGVYMPDIELLLPLGEILGVSVNELLSGRRLDDAEFRRASDENIVAAARSNAFSVGERIKFWEAKWIREHVAIIVIAVVFVFAWLCVGVALSLPAVSSFTPIIGLIVYVVIRNRMMIYVEGKVFGDGK